MMLKFILGADSFEAVAVLMAGNIIDADIPTPAIIINSFPNDIISIP